MSESSLVPERQLVFSPALAATIGLGEAILLQQLQALFDHYSPELRDGRAWLSVERALLLRTLPFWGLEDLQRICRSLVDKGVLLVSSPPLHQGEYLVFALNELVPQARQREATPIPAAVVAPAMPTRRSAALLPLHWSPSEDMLQLLGLNHNIPRQFALDQLEDFIFYWRERGETSHAWENKFRQHVISNWRHHQQNQAEAFRTPENTRLDNSWRPSLDALEIMERGGIDREFIEEAIPEFILYWRERGAAPKELNSAWKPPTTPGAPNVCVNFAGDGSCAAATPANIANGNQRNCVCMCVWGQGARSRATSRPWRGVRRGRRATGGWRGSWPSSPRRRTRGDGIAPCRRRRRRRR